MTDFKTPDTGVSATSDELDAKDLEQVVGGTDGDLIVEVNLTQLANFVCGTLDQAIKQVMPCGGGPIGLYCVPCIYHGMRGGGAG